MGKKKNNSHKWYDLIQNPVKSMERPAETLPGFGVYGVD